MWRTQRDVEKGDVLLWMASERKASVQARSETGKSTEGKFILAGMRSGNTQNMENVTENTFLQDAPADNRAISAGTNSWTCGPLASAATAGQPPPPPFFGAFSCGCTAPRRSLTESLPPQASR